MNETLQQRIEEAAKKFATTTDGKIMSFAYLAAKQMANFILDNQWISVDEALPEYYRNVLVIFDDLHIINAFFDGECWWWNDGFVIGVNSYGDAIYSSQQSCEDKPTHWMPIPQLKGGE